MVSERQARELGALVSMIEGTPPGEPFFMGSLRLTTLHFLCDRPGVTRFPAYVDAATPAQRRGQADDLARALPRLAFVEKDAIFAPFADAHPEEWAVLKAHYRQVADTGRDLIFERRSK
jgi:hypothetical protein